MRVTNEGLTELIKNEDTWIPPSERRPVKHYKSLTFDEQESALDAGGIYGFEHVAVVVDHQVGAEAGEKEDEDEYAFVDYGMDEEDCRSEKDGEEEGYADEEAGDENGAPAAGAEAAGHEHAVPENTRYVAPQKLKTCRLSRELGPIFSVSWGTQRRRPATLARRGDCADFPETLQQIGFRDDGKVYYSAKPLWDSPSAAWLMTACDITEEDLFCRLPLLLTPIKESFALSSADVIFCDDRQGPQLEVVDDGMARVSEQTLRAMGCWHKRHLAFQFRGVLHSGATDSTALVKGMAKFDLDLASGFAFPSAVRKAVATGLADAPILLDVVKWTDRVLAKPWLNASFYSALCLGVRMMPEGRPRDEGEVLNEKLLMAAKESTLEHLIRCSWNVPAIDLPPNPQALRAVDRPVVDTWEDAPCCDANQVRFTYADIGIAQRVVTPTEALLEEREETAPHTMAHGRKENLLRGRSRFWAKYSSMQKKPKLHLPGFGATLTCLVDTSGTLRDRQCYFNVGGTAASGECTVWRCRGLGARCRVSGPPWRIESIPTIEVRCFRGILESSRTVFRFVSNAWPPMWNGARMAGPQCIFLMLSGGLPARVARVTIRGKGLAHGIYVPFGGLYDTSLDGGLAPRQRTGSVVSRT